MAREHKPLPWTRFSYDDFFDDEAVAAMNNTQVGAYMRLLRCAWRSPEPGVIPGHAIFLARASQLFGEWEASAAVLEAAFEASERPSGRVWIQRRIVREYALAARVRRQKSHASLTMWGRRRQLQNNSATAQPPEKSSTSIEVLASPLLDFRSKRESKNKTLAREARSRVLQSESPEFIEFYEQIWPRRVGRDAAWRRFEKLQAQGVIAEVMAGAEAWADYYADSRTSMQFIPHPSTWLNQGRWKDQPPPVEPREPS